LKLNIVGEKLVTNLVSELQTEENKSIEKVTNELYVEIKVFRGKICRNPDTILKAKCNRYWVNMETLGHRSFNRRILIQG